MGFPYTKVIKGAKSLLLMSSFAGVDRVPTAGDEHLLNQVLE